LRRAGLIAAGGLLAGCLEAPEGRPQTWPAADAPTIAAVVAGDFDGDGTTDLVAVASGLASDGAGAYLIRGGVDLAMPDDAPITSFSRMSRLDLEPQIAAIAVELDDGGPGLDLVIAHIADGGVQLTGLRGDDLTVIGDTTLDLAAPPSTQDISFSTVEFPGHQGHVAVLVGDDIRHLPVAGLLDDDGRAQLPPPMGEGKWTPRDVAEALAAKDRARCGPVAPPDGLYLVRVDY